MANELTVLTPPAKIISAADGVITAESPMTQQEFELLNKLLIQIRTEVSDRDWVPNYYENIANQMLAHTHELCEKYALPTTGGRYYVIALETGRHLQWWSEAMLDRMGYAPAIGGR